jgi:hypothetical protein
MPRLKIAWSAFFLIFMSVVPVLAQDDCPLLVESALEAAELQCNSVSRNQACYGNINLQAEGQPEAPPITFTAPGDIADLNRIRNLRLDGMNTSTGVWGIAMMRVQANLPDSNPAQNVTIILFGDVSIQNEAPMTVTLPATIIAPTSANLRLSPSTDSPVVSSLTNGTQLTATGRDVSGEWIQVRLDGEQGGWVFRELLSIDGDVDALSILQGGRYTPQYGPMQAFILNTGISDSPCSSAPSSGILIQTPEGVGEISLLINEVDIRLGSTAYITAGQSEDGGNDLGVHLVEGHARVEAEGVAQFLQSGQQLDVPLGEDLHAVGQPTDPQPYDARDAQLPLELTSTETEPEVEPVEPYVPDSSAPVITRVDVTRLSSTQTREDIEFIDLEGDVTSLDISMADISDNSINYIFRGTEVNIDAETQQTGATFSRETICTEGTDGVNALFRIVLTDAQGFASNVVEYRTTCGEGG